MSTPPKRKPMFTPCPGAVENKRKPGDFEMCQDAITEFLCPKHWGRVSKKTRREFVEERNRLREERIHQPSALMKKLIEAAIVESAIRLKPDDLPPVVEVVAHPFKSAGPQGVVRFVAPGGYTIAAGFSVRIGKMARQAAQRAVVSKAKEEGFAVEAADLIEEQKSPDASEACDECGRVTEDPVHHV